MTFWSVAVGVDIPEALSDAPGGTKTLRTKQAPQQNPVLFMISIYWQDDDDDDDD